MKNILFLLILLIFNSCQPTQKKISSTDQVGEEFFYIIDNIENIPYNNFVEKFITRKKLLSILSESNFSEEYNTKVYKYFLNINDTEYYSSNKYLKFNKEFYDEIKEDLILRKEKGKFKYKDFTFKRNKDEGLELYNGTLECEIISSLDENQVTQFYCLFIVHEDEYYLLGFD